MKDFASTLGINLDDVLNSIDAGNIGDAFMLCNKYMIYCWYGKNLRQRLLCLSEDEFMSEAYIAFHYSASKFDRTAGKAFLDYFYKNLERHLFYVSLDSNFVTMSKCYRTRRTIDHVIVQNFVDDTNTESSGESTPTGIVLSLIASEENHIEDLENLDLLSKLMEHVQERDWELLLNPMELDFDDFVGGQLSTRRSVKGTKANWLKKLRKILPDYV